MPRDHQMVRDLGKLDEIGKDEENALESKQGREKVCRAGRCHVNGLFDGQRDHCVGGRKWERVG